MGALRAHCAVRSLLNAIVASGVKRTNQIVHAAEIADQRTMHQEHADVVQNVRNQSVFAVKDAKKTSAGAVAVVNQVNVHAKFVEPAEYLHVDVEDALDAGEDMWTVFVISATNAKGLG